VRKYRSLKGKQFGDLVVTRDDKKKLKTNYVVYCTCLACGREDVLRYRHMLTCGRSTHCGCLTEENRMKHGCTNTSLYHSWKRLCCLKRTSELWQDFQQVLSTVGYDHLDHKLTEQNPKNLLGPENYVLVPSNVIASNRLIEIEVGVYRSVKSIAAWSKIIGVSRQRGHQLYKQNLLVDRIKEHLKKEGQ